MLKTFITYIYLLAAGQGLFLSVLMVSSGRFRNKILAVLTGILTLLFSYNLLYYFLGYSGYMSQVPHLFMTHGPLILLYGPIIFLMFRLMTEESFGLEWRHLFHIIPFVVFVAAFLPMFLLPAEIKLQIYQRDMSIDGIYPFSWRNLLINISLGAHLIIYVGATYSSVRDSFFRFPKGLLILPAAFASLYIVYQVMHFSGVPYSSYLCYIVKLAMGITIYWLSYFVFIKNGTVEPDSRKEKYQTSGIDSQTSKALSEKITTRLEQEQLFLDANLTLKCLAESMKMPPHYISQAINQHLNMSFSDLLNKYRIEYAKQLLAETNEKIISVAYSSGFNNKVSFINAFRKQTSTTPLAFRTSYNAPKR